MTRFLAVVGVLLVAAGASLACHPVCRIAYVAPVIKAVKVKQVIVTELVPVVVQVPTYSVSYVPPPATAPAPSADIDEMRQLREENARLRGQAAAPKDLAGLVALRCATCHSETAAKDKGGEFVLLDKGKVPPLSLAEKKRIGRLVGGDKMPPQHPLSADEKKLLEEFLNPKEG